MSDTNIVPHKDMVDPKTLTKIIEDANYVKPDWMVNDSVTDETWLLTRTGYDVSYFKKNPHLASRLTFKRKTGIGEHLTDKVNNPLLIDIQQSLLYLFTTGKLTRPERASAILISACKLILHTNELRYSHNKQPIRALSQIKFEELKDYLLAFNVERRSFDKTIRIIMSRWEDKSAIDWDALGSESNMTSRKFESLKHKLLNYLKFNDSDFNSVKNTNREYQNANQVDFDIELDLFPKEKTISNEISKLECLFTATPAQRYKFQHSSMSLFSGGKSIFDDMIEPVKTALMPLNVSMHALSSALHFAKCYGAPLRLYLSDLYKVESMRIKELNQPPYIIQRNFSDIKKFAFDNTPIPDSLKSLNLVAWGGKGDDKNPKGLKNGISVCTAVTLYAAATWIFLASFTAGRLTSLLTLKRDCFRFSPVDFLFDVVVRIPKSSERYQLEEVHRPIPDLIFDYGVEFAALLCELENRQGSVAEESELFLFGGILNNSLMAAFNFGESKTFLNSMSDDYINGAIALFQDWSNSPLIEGKRWYPTTHQFRRLFAVLYFNFTDQMGLDELSWFMGHANLDQTFHYAELAPDDEWIEEAELTIARIGASLHKSINGDQTVKNIIANARENTTINTILQPLVLKMIEDHKAETGQQVRFCKIDGEDVFFYFTDASK